MKSDGCRRWWLRGDGPALKEINTFDVNGSKRFERQWDERVRLLKIIIIIIYYLFSILGSKDSEG